MPARSSLASACERPTDEGDVGADEDWAHPMASDATTKRGSKGRTVLITVIRCCTTAISSAIRLVGDTSQTMSAGLDVRPLCALSGDIVLDCTV